MVIINSFFFNVYPSYQSRGLYYNPENRKKPLKKYYDGTSLGQALSAVLTCLLYQRCPAGGAVCSSQIQRGSMKKIDPNRNRMESDPFQ